MYYKNEYDSQNIILMPKYHTNAKMFKISKTDAMSLFKLCFNVLAMYIVAAMHTTISFKSIKF